MLLHVRRKAVLHSCQLVLLRAALLLWLEYNLTLITIISLGLHNLVEHSFHW